MEQHSRLNDAGLLVEGNFYIHLPRPYDKRATGFSLVKFIAFNPCPALVVVEDTQMRRFTCERASLFHME